MISDYVLVSDPILNLGLILFSDNCAVLGCSSSCTRWFLECTSMNRRKCSILFCLLRFWVGFFLWITIRNSFWFASGIKLSFVWLSLGDDFQEFCYIKILCTAQSVYRVKPSPRRYLIEGLSLETGYLFRWTINFAAMTSWVEWPSAGPYQAAAQCGTV